MSVDNLVAGVISLNEFVRSIGNDIRDALQASQSDVDRYVTKLQAIREERAKLLAMSEEEVAVAMRTRSEDRCAALNIAIAADTEKATRLNAALVELSKLQAQATGVGTHKVFEKLIWTCQERFHELHTSIQFAEQGLETINAVIDLRWAPSFWLHQQFRRLKEEETFFQSKLEHEQKRVEEARAILQELEKLIGKKTP